MGALRESRPLVVTTGSVTLILLLLAVFNRTDRTQNSTFSLLYFLAIVMLSYAFSAMLKEREKFRVVRGRQTQLATINGQSLDTNGVPFTTVVVYHSPNTAGNGSQVVSNGCAADQTVIDGFKDLPPPYEDCPPPKYEDVASNCGQK